MTLKRSSWGNRNIPFTKWFLGCVSKQNPPDTLVCSSIFRNVEWMFAGTHRSILSHPSPRAPIPKGNARSLSWQPGNTLSAVAVAMGTAKLWGEVQRPALWGIHSHQLQEPDLAPQGLCSCQTRGLKGGDRGGGVKREVFVFYWKQGRRKTSNGE